MNYETLWPIAGIILLVGIACAFIGFFYDRENQKITQIAQGTGIILVLLGSLLGGIVIGLLI